MKGPAARMVKGLRRAARLLMRVEHGSPGYGHYLWIVNRVRFSSRGTLNPDYPGPRFYRSFDEHGSRVLSAHLYRLGAVNIWLK